MRFTQNEGLPRCMHCLWCSNPDGMKSEDKHKEYMLDELANEAKSCKPMFFAAEVLRLQAERQRLIKKVRLRCLKGLKNNIQTAIEANGASPHLEKLLPYYNKT